MDERVCRGGRGRAFALWLLLLAALPAALPARAQVPSRPDTLRPDTLRALAPPARPDTVRRDTTLRDTTLRDTTLRDTTLRDTTLRDTTLRDTTLRDTTLRDTVAADTTQGPRRRRTLTEQEALDFQRGRPGRAVAERIPARDPALDATALLARGPGTFRYDLGGVGWPHGVSFRGRPPAQTPLMLDGLPFSDPLTGRPRYDLLPLPFMQPLHVQTGAGGTALGAPNAVRAALRPYRFGRPLTVLRYRTRGFQSIGALHTQRRKVHFFGPPAFMQFTGGYFGRASDNLNFLPGSDLRRERRVLGRVRYRRRAWALQLSALHNRRRLGANGGVDLAGRPLPFVFTRAPVRFSRARRRLLRTDLAATLRLRTPLAGPPLTATAYWTGQTYRYRNPALTDTLPAADTLAAETDRYGLRLTQRLTLRTERLGRHALALEAHAWTDRRARGNALAGGPARTLLHLTARDSTRLLGSSATLSAGLHTGPVQTYPSAGVRLARAPGGHALRLFAQAALTGQPVSWIEAQGFGPLVQPLADGQAPGSVLSARVGAAGPVGPVAARLTFFADRTTDRLDLYALAPEATAQALVAKGVFQKTGATLAARWRADAERGLYATASGTAFLRRSGTSPLLSPAADAVPRFYGHGRLGARFALFTDDLGVDAYAQGRFWSKMKSRTLHTPTGRLILPPSQHRSLGAGGVLDLHAEATIRTATLFFSYENALSGTRVQQGAFTVPFYPLPAQFFRFGVYWPIFN